MRKVRIAVLVAAIAAGGCTTAAGAPASVAPPMATSTATPPAVPVQTPTPTARPTPTTLDEPIPDALIGAWHSSAPAWWWFLRAGAPTCVAVAHTKLDCVAYQLVGQPAFVGDATMAGRVLHIHWVWGYCAGQKTAFGTGFDGVNLKLFDLPDDCGGSDFVLSPAGTGATPTAPPPPGS